MLELEGATFSRYSSGPGRRDEMIFFEEVTEIFGYYVPRANSASVSQNIQYCPLKLSPNIQ